MAINSWLSNIVKVQGQNIYIEKPNMPNLDPLKYIRNEWLIIIALFVQHKNMNTAKLSRILGISTEELDRKVNNLANAGIIVLRTKEIYTLSRYLEPFLVKICLEKGII